MFFSLSRFKAGSTNRFTRYPKHNYSMRLFEACKMWMKRFVIDQYLDVITFEMCKRQEQRRSTSFKKGNLCSIIIVQCIDLLLAPNNSKDNRIEFTSFSIEFCHIRTMGEWVWKAMYNRTPFAFEKISVSSGKRTRDRQRSGYWATLYRCSFEKIRQCFCYSKCKRTIADVWDVSWTCLQNIRNRGI